jgi:hypothetical protein
MLRTISGDEGPRRAGARRRFPARRLHLVDIENLAGVSARSVRRRAFTPVAWRSALWIRWRWPRAT